MGDLHMRIERLEKRAIEEELVAQLSSNENVSPKNQERTKLRSRIKELKRRLAGRSASIKLLLLDQSIIAGLGNIYVCEALYRAGIHPARAGGSISAERLERLVPAIHDVLEEAIAAGGSTLRDFASPDGELGYFSKSFAVYDREGLPCGCGSTVKRIVQGGRSTFFCPKCQR